MIYHDRDHDEDLNDHGFDHADDVKVHEDHGVGYADDHVEDHGMTRNPSHQAPRNPGSPSTRPSLISR